MRKRVGSVKNIRTIKAYRGESLTINLGKTYAGGTLTAWMKKDPDDTTYRSFEIVDQATIKLTAEKASDYTDGFGNITETVEGKWYFDVEFLSDDVGAEPETVVAGTILFVNDITNSAGYEVTDPNTGNTIIENVVQTSETNLDLLQTPGQFSFDIITNTPTNITFTANGGGSQNLAYLIDSLSGVVVRVFNKHEDNQNSYTHLVQQIEGGDKNVMLRRTYSTSSSTWTDWKSLEGDLPAMMVSLNLDTYQSTGVFTFDKVSYNAIDYTFTTDGGVAETLDEIVYDIVGATLVVSSRFKDNDDGFIHITQSLISGYDTGKWQRQYQSEDGYWSPWKRLDVDGTPLLSVGNDLDSYTKVGDYSFNVPSMTTTNTTYTIDGGVPTPISALVGQLAGTTLKVTNKHKDSDTSVLHITQELTEGLTGKTWRRQYNSTQGYWRNWLETTAQGVSTLSALTDTAISSPSESQVLTYHSGSGTWRNADATGGSSEYHKPFIATTLAAASFVTNAADTISEIWDDESAVQGFNGSYTQNGWMVNDINTYDILYTFEEAVAISEFVYTGFHQFANMTVDTCEIWAITDSADIPTNFGAQASTTNLTKIWDSDAGADPAFAPTVSSHQWDFKTNAANTYTLSTPVLSCYGIVFRPKTNKGHASRTMTTKLLFT